MVKIDRRISGLDGLRAISITLVLVAHLADGWWLAPYGGFGVSIFFVISGFLITWLLCLEEDKHTTISLAAFYVRRALRILPPALLFLVVVQVLSWRGMADVAEGDFLHSALFIRNMTSGGKDTGHFWSLAIEEHFYLIWPVLFLLLRSNTKRLIFVAGLFGFWPGWYYFRVHHGAGPAGFDIHCVYLLAGCALALARHDRGLVSWLSSKMLKSALVPPFAIAAVCLVSSPGFPIGCLVGALNAMAVVAVINYSVEHHGGFLNWPPIVRRQLFLLLDDNYFSRSTTTTF